MNGHSKMNTKFDLTKGLKGMDDRNKMNTKLDFAKGLKGINVANKMSYSSNTVVELRNIARQRGLVGYSKLRKADLIEKIIANDNNDLLDAPVPDIPVPTLVPTPFSSKAKRAWNKVVDTTESAIKSAASKTKSAIVKFADWILGYVPEKSKTVVYDRLGALKKDVNDIFNKLRKNKFEIRETATAIKGFTKRYTIEGTDGIVSTPRVFSMPSDRW